MILDLAIAVGPNVFRSETNMLVELLIRIQSILFLFIAAFCFFFFYLFFSFLESAIDYGDTHIAHYLIATWVKVCQVMVPEFEPYLPVVIPSLLATGSAKADSSVYGRCSSRFLDIY